MKKTVFALILLVLGSVVLAHAGEEHSSVNEELQHHETGGEIIFWLGVSTAIILLTALYSLLFIEKMSENQKKVSFAIIAIATVLATLFVLALTVQKNLESETGGPVHWHADFEVWVCGERIELEQPTDFDNKLGTNVFHHHNDNRIHVEGTPKNVSDVRLGNFFAIIGGKFDENTIAVVQKDLSLIRRENGYLCNGKPGTVQLYVNGERNHEMGDYVISPHPTVPPGDYLHIVFGSKEGVPDGG